MKCRNCGAEIKEGAAFCPKCGVKQEAGLTQTPQPGPEKNKLLKGAIFGIGAVALAVAAAIVAAVVLLPGKDNSLGRQEPVMADDGENVADEEENPFSEQTESESETQQEPAPPLYSIADVPWIDTEAQNYAAGAKQPGMTWDSSFFYWLEDISMESLEDGYIANCKVTKTLLRDAQSQKLRQYEIYSDPVSGAVYKIVSIEETENGLSLVDYYYQNGQPNFIFQRGDTVYTPTYATIEKVGERFYFNNETMVRWRMIREPGVVGEYVLAPGDVWYSQGDYYAENEELRAIYDETELRMLNAAHNTYDAITSGGSVGMVQGYLWDTVGNAIAGRTVRICRISDNVPLYETATDEGGRYAFFVYLDDTECYIKVDADDLYKETTVQGVRLAPSAATYTYGLTMHKNSGDEYPVTFHLYSCMDVVSDENGTAVGAALQNITATVREGAGNYSGEPVRTAETQNGELAVNLPSGVYTVQFHTEGYLDSYKEVDVAEAGAAEDVYVMPGLEETQTGVILTWESEEADLDLTLFTPYQAENGDMDHIGGSRDWDGHGNILVSDNTSGCEVMFINSGAVGSYKLYVNNYTDSLAGSYASDALSRLNAHIYIYDSNGFVSEYRMPSGETGVVWEVAEINGHTVTPAQRVYKEISGKSWWTENKEVWNAEEDATLLECLEMKNSSLRGLMESLVHSMADEKINALLQGQKEGIEDFFGLDGDEMPAAVYLSYINENHPAEWEELREQKYYEHFLTEENAEYLLYSLCGKRIDFDFSAYDGWTAPYIGFGGAAGDISWDTLEHFSLERVDANTWNVRANDVYSCEHELSRVVSRICFTVIKNPDSCFDGYSLTAFAVEEKADVEGWAKTYYDYLTTDPGGISAAENYGLEASIYAGGGFQYELIYLDDDLIPEIYMTGNSYAEGDLLLHIVNGTVVEEIITNFGGAYIPYTGLLRDENGRSGGLWQDNYKLENGRLTELGGWYGHWSDMDMETGYPIDLPPGEPIVEVIDGYSLDGTSVTKEQYDEMINNYFGSAELQNLPSENQLFDVLTSMSFLF